MIYLIHGFNVKDEGAETVDTIKGLLEIEGQQITEIGNEQKIDKEIIDYLLSKLTEIKK